MTDGKEWNAPENVALDEYGSIIEAHYEHVLRPVVQGNERLNRDAVSMVKSDLELKINNPNFKKLPFRIRNAYRSFMESVKILENSTDKEVNAAKPILEELFSIGISCHTYGDEIMSENGIYKDRNPCRDDQYKLNLAIKKAERKGKSKLLDAVKKMAHVCTECPYRSIKLDIEAPPENNKYSKVTRIDRGSF